jgi:hypothetical protein
MEQMNSREFLQEVLTHPDDIEIATMVEQLVSEHIQEDTWLDYKDGKWTANVETRELRKDITAFGNSDGGCLVIGVTERDKRPVNLAPCNGNLERAIEQIHGVIRSLAGLLLPPPCEVRQVNVAGHSVIVIAIPRSARMAPVVEQGISRYYLRVADGTSAIPDYLLSDLFFGRRQCPILGLRYENSTSTVSNKGRRIDVYLTIENRGITHANGVYAGTLFGSLECESHSKLRADDPVSKLTAWTLESPHLHKGHQVLGVATSYKSQSISPFTSYGTGFWALLPSDALEWTVAIYVALRAFG